MSAQETDKPEQEANVAAPADTSANPEEAGAEASAAASAPEPATDNVVEEAAGAEAGQEAGTVEGDAEVKVSDVDADPDGEPDDAAVANQEEAVDETGEGQGSPIEQSGETQEEELAHDTDRDEMKLFAPPDAADVANLDENPEDESDYEGSDYNDEDEDFTDDEEEERNKSDIRQALEEWSHLVSVNKERQKKVLLLWEKEKQHKRGSVDEKLPNSQQNNFEQLRVQYTKTLDQLNILWDNLDQKREEAEDKIDKLTSKLDRQDEKATELSDSFKAFKREVAKEARFSRTDKPVPLKRILAYEANEESRDREVAEVRLKHIALWNSLKQLEDEVKQKEELAEGLHLIDFEQLKIENQTLNEKIEERNDELHKLRKKTTTTVQVLTHIKEKLKFVKQENEGLKREKEGLDTEVKQFRDRLTKVKRQRDLLRMENADLKQKQGFIGSDMLVADFEGRKDTLEEKKAVVVALKAKHARLSNLVERAKQVEEYQIRMQQTQMQTRGLRTTQLRR